jgi:hypothetical protein
LRARKKREAFQKGDSLPCRENNDDDVVNASFLWSIFVESLVREKPSGFRSALLDIRERERERVYGLYDEDIHHALKEIRKWVVQNSGEDSSTPLVLGSCSFVIISRRGLQMVLVLAS